MYVCMHTYIHTHIHISKYSQNEMAHYARECWDAEVLTTFGWIEVVGHADRSCYDLESHTNATGVELTAFEEFDQPIEEECIVPNLNK